MFNCRESRVSLAKKMRARSLIIHFLLFLPITLCRCQTNLAKLVSISDHSLRDLPLWRCLQTSLIFLKKCQHKKMCSTQYFRTKFRRSLRYNECMNVKRVSPSFLELLTAFPVRTAKLGTILHKNDKMVIKKPEYMKPFVYKTRLFKIYTDFSEN